MVRQWVRPVPEARPLGIAAAEGLDDAIGAKLARASTSLGLGIVAAQSQFATCHGLPSVGLDSNRLAQLFDSLLLQALPKTGYDGFGNAGPFIDHAGIHLYQGGACQDLLPRVGGVENSPDADDGQCSTGLPVEMANHFGASGTQRSSAQASGFGIDALHGRIAGLRPRNGRIRCDNAGDLAWTG
jgi:hypothetical protein